MNELTHFVGRVLRGLIKLSLVLAAGIFVVSFLLAAAVLVLLMSLWSLLTGRKPAPVVMFGRMRERSQRYTQGVWPGREPAGEVVDVVATEVSEGTVGSATPEQPLQRLR